MEDNLKNLLIWLTDINGGGVARKVLANYCGCHASTITSYLNNEHAVSPAMRQKIKQGLTLYLTTVN